MKIIAALCCPVDKLCLSLPHDNYEPKPSMTFRPGNITAACLRKRHNRLQGAPSVGIRKRSRASASHYSG